MGLAALAPPAFAKENGERITVTGEAIDTWCYLFRRHGRGPMLLWVRPITHALCGALQGVFRWDYWQRMVRFYMVLKIENDDTSNGGDTQLSVASHSITADGTYYARDGIKLFSGFQSRRRSGHHQP
jgi:hypothetical protein